MPKQRHWNREFDGGILLRFDLGCIWLSFTLWPMSRPCIQILSGDTCMCTCQNTAPPLSPSSSTNLLTSVFFHSLTRSANIFFALMICYTHIPYTGAYIQVSNRRAARHGLYLPEIDLTCSPVPSISTRISVEPISISVAFCNWTRHPDTSRINLIFSPPGPVIVCMYVCTDTGQVSQAHSVRRRRKRT